MSDVNTNGGALADGTGAGHQDTSGESQGDVGGPNNPQGGSQQAGNNGSGGGENTGGPG